MRVVLGAVLAVATPGAAAAAQSQSASYPDDTARPKTVRVQALGEWAFSRLNRAHELLSEEKYDDAIRMLDVMRKRKLNANETASMWQTYGYVYASQEKYAEAAEAFQKCLDVHGLAETAQNTTRSYLAQVYLAEGDYDNAIETLETWMAEVADPGPDGHYMLAMAYAHTGKHDEALPHAEQAVAESEAPHEGRLALLVALYFENERHADAVPLLRQLVTNFPKKTYWVQLSAAYWEMHDLDNTLAVQEAIFEQGMFDQNHEYVTLAQLLLQHEVPFEAASVLETGFQAGVVENKPETWELLANAYLQARSFDEAIRPLARAAELAGTGEAYMRLGQIELSQEDWAAAAETITKAIRTGGLGKDAGRAYLLLGIAQVGDSRFDEARKTFATAQGYQSVAEAAVQWAAYVDQETKLIADENQLLSGFDDRVAARDGSKTTLNR